MPPSRFAPAAVLACAALAATALTGCERPFIDPTPPTIEVVQPADLGVVRTSDRLPLVLRATSFRAVARVEVNGEAATYNAENDVFLDTLGLTLGLNVLRVAAFDGAGAVGTDTLYALYWPGQAVTLGGVALPEGRAEHAATVLPNGDVLLTGGVTAGGTLPAATLRVTESAAGPVSVTTGAPLATPRRGHTATRLPDGRVLVAGGFASGDAFFAPTAELYDPATGAFTTLPTRGPAIARAGHTAVALARDGRTFVYLYGGRGIVGSTGSGPLVGTLSTVDVLEIQATAAGDSLINRSPEGGAGSFEPVAGHVQVPLPALGEASRTLIAGLYEDPGGAGTPVAFRLLFRPSSTFFPFDLGVEAVAPPAVPRAWAAADRLAPGLVLLTGGRAADRQASDRLDVFADEAGRFFAYDGDAVALSSARWAHSATRLPSGRILLAGGYGPAGTPLASAELFFAP